MIIDQEVMNEKVTTGNIPSSCVIFLSQPSPYRLRLDPILVQLPVIIMHLPTINTAVERHNFISLRRNAVGDGQLI